MAKAEKVAPTFVRYVTKEKAASLFDILIKGDWIYGSIGDDGRAVFDVPSDKVDAFEEHWHCQVGNIVRHDAPVSAPATPPAS